MPEQLIPSDAVKAIQASAQLQELNGYYNQPPHLPPADPTPDPIQTNTLQSILDFVEMREPFRSVNMQFPTTQHIAVLSPTKVLLQSSPHGNRRSRIVFVQSEFKFDGYPFDRFIPLDDAIPQMLSRFVATSNLSTLLAALGNITDGTVRTLSDDGVSQEVTVRKGIQRQDYAKLDKYVSLRPYRTFIEIEQPESIFALRLKSKEGSSPEVALMPADGGMWRYTAIQSIKQFFDDRTEIPVIG